MRKILSFTVALLLVVSVTPIQPTQAQQIFADVPTTHDYYDEIMYLLENDVIVESSIYGLNDIVTREEVAVMVSKAVGLDGTPRSTIFSDVPKSNPNSGYIQSAAEKGILGGYSDGTFKPNKKVTRGQMAVFIANAFELPNGDTTFKDVKQGQTGYDQIKKLVAAGITTGYPDGTFKPSNNLTRGHISLFLVRAMKYDGVGANDVTNVQDETVQNGINYEQIYEVDGTGEYAGYKRLVGYPSADKYAIYYRGSYDSYEVTHTDLEQTNLQEKINWTYNGKVYTNTRSQLYSFFSDITKLEGLLGQSKGIINQEWLEQTFGETYQDWFYQGLYSQEAASIVEKYLQLKEGIILKDRHIVVDIDFESEFNYTESDYSDSVDPYVWISNKDLKIKTDGIELSNMPISIKDDKVVRVPTFIEAGGLTGTVYRIYEVTEMPEDYLDSTNNSEDTFNGIRFKKENGILYINREDLKGIGILP